VKIILNFSEFILASWYVCDCRGLMTGETQTLSALREAAAEALAAKRGEINAARLRGTSREMYDLMTARELRQLVDEGG